MPNGDSKNSAIKQVASGRFGVTSQYLVNARELQIKMAQGAKPGEGGRTAGPPRFIRGLPQTRLNHAGRRPDFTARRTTTFYSIEDLAQLVHDLKNANRNARVRRGNWSREVAAWAPLPPASPRRMPTWCSSAVTTAARAHRRSLPSNIRAFRGKLGLAETHQTLVLNNLRSRIYVETDGQLKTGRDGGGRRAARRGGIRICDRAARRARLSHDARYAI